MTSTNIRIGFIGGGNMAQAIVGGLLNCGHEPGRIIVADPSGPQRAAVLNLHAQITVEEHNAAAVAFADVLVLAVKPQIMADVVPGLTAAKNLPRLILSIAAGITLGRLQGWFGSDAALVRVMPNQPALVGAGMSVLIANPACKPEHRDDAEYVASAVGQSAWITDESLMDAVTAISGSGPAYFYLLQEIMEDCAREMGLSEDLARLLTRQTAMGAGLAALESSHSNAELRASVTSRGGTTAAALEVLESRGIRDIISAALEAAQRRSQELGKD